MNPVTTCVSQDWTPIIGAIFVGLTSLVGAIGAVMATIRGRANTVKLDANLAQSAEVARATPGADVLPQTSALVNKAAQ